MIAKHCLYSIFIASMTLASSSYAVEPLSEDALSDFALESGDVILQIYGSTAAGLQIDIEGDDADGANESASVDDTAIESAKISIEKLEDELTKKFQNETQGVALDPNLDAIFKPVERVVGQAQVFDTTSEIRYDKSNFKHDPTFNDDGSVRMDRDMQIDLLKLENLSGDDRNDQRVFGNIYLSDWSSQGTTTTTVRE